MANKKYFFLSVVFFTFLLFIVPAGSISSDLGNTVLTVVAFLFGIIAGFYIVVTMGDHNKMRDILASVSAQWIFLHHSVVVYHPESSKELASRIDIYLRRNFDYEIIDCTRMTNTEFLEIEKTIRNVPVLNERSSEYQTIQTSFAAILTARQQLTVLGTRTLTGFQWLVLSSLGTLFVVSLYAMRSGEPFFDVVAVILSSSIVMLLLLIRDLDLYLWNESTFGFDIFQNIFRAIGELPYYPAESIAEKRISPSEAVYRAGVPINGNHTKRTIEIRKK